MGDIIMSKRIYFLLSVIFLTLGALIYALYRPSSQIAVFCDSEFFHGKDWEVLRPRLEKSNNSEYWINKISRNCERDDEVNKRLLFEGWTVIRFWGKDIKKHCSECADVIEEKVRGI